MLLSPCFKAGKWFVPTTYVNDRNGESYPSFNATRDRLSLLAVGFTGSRALGFKVSNSMERTLRQTPVAIATKQKLSNSLVRETRKLLDFPEANGHLSPAARCAIPWQFADRATLGR